MNDLSVCGEACNCVNCRTKTKQAVIDDVTLLHRKLIAIQPLDVPQYMFKDKRVTPSTWIDIQNMQLDCYELGNHIALLIDPVTREYLYVFWDEAAQCSNPYPSYSDALAACKRYMETL